MDVSSHGDPLPAGLRDTRRRDRRYPRPHWGAGGHPAPGAPVAPRPDGWPTILYSHGFSTNRALATTMLEDLASRGYVVVAIDHTHDAAEVEFPDGRLETAAITLPTDITAAQKVLATAVEVRTADVRFVLDQPDVVGRSLPGGLRCAARTAGVGVLGHSLGGATAASLMHADKRVVAGVNLDGFVFGPAPAAGLRRPFLQIGTTDHGLHNDPSWAALAANSRGWHRELRLTGARHMAFTDLQTAVPQLAPRLGLPAEQVTALLGTLAADRSVAIQRAYVSAFFDLHLRHQNRNLLDRPSPEYPEIVFVQP